MRTIGPGLDPEHVLVRILNPYRYDILVLRWEDIQHDDMPGQLMKSEYIFGRTFDQPCSKSNMQPVYRQLAPAPPGSNPEPCGAVPQEKKKKKARMACNYCRRKRVRVSSPRQCPVLPSLYPF